MGSIGFYWVLLGFIRFYRVLLGLRDVYRVLLGFCFFFFLSTARRLIVCLFVFFWFHWNAVGFMDLDRVFTEFYWVSFFYNFFF